MILFALAIGLMIGMVVGWAITSYRAMQDVMSIAIQQQQTIQALREKVIEYERSSRNSNGG